jgi:hypothetical protein
LIDHDALATWFGSSDAPPLTERGITLHHKDGNHDNHDTKNIGLCHSTCHKAHHMKERQALKKKGIKK